ncbi:MAG: hypothetical protein M1817_004385 [Caeruleum heppii]|nr:MAG: hypothetical protein M1817_004385 [Caeruleum heppii]
MVGTNSIVCLSEGELDAVEASEDEILEEAESAALLEPEAVLELADSEAGMEAESKGTGDDAAMIEKEPTPDGPDSDVPGVAGSNAVLKALVIALELVVDGVETAPSAVGGFVCEGQMWNRQEILIL